MQMFLEFIYWFQGRKKKKSNLAAVHCVNVYLHACVCFSLHRQGQQMSFITVKMPNKLSTPPCLLRWCLRSRTHARVCGRRAELLRPAAPAVVTPWIFYYCEMEERDIWTKCIICRPMHPGSCVPKISPLFTCVLYAPTLSAFLRCQFKTALWYKCRFSPLWHSAGSLGRIDWCST